LKATGFSSVMDYVDIKEPDSNHYPSKARRALIKMLKGIPPVKHGFLLFHGWVFFACRK
jgi:hypothetical protein